MPFKSEKQRKWMHTNEPEIAKSWEKKKKKEALSASQAKAAHDKFKETGELPPHLKKLVKKIKKFEKEAKVKNIVVPGLEWMSKIKETRTINVEPNWEGMWRFFKQMAKTNPKDWKRMERTLGSDWKKIDAMAKKNKWTESVNEAKTTSIDGTKLMNFLMKRFKFSKKKAIDTMKKAGMDTSFIKEARDYKAEYKKFQSSTKSKKYRAELNKYNRKKGTYGNGDGKDASHKNGKIAGFESQSKNRGRAEKSRLKKEIQVNELVPPMAVSNPAAYKAMLDKQIAKNVKVKTALGNKDHKDHKKAKSLYQRFMDKFKKKKDKPKKAAPKKQSKSDADFYKRQFTGENIKTLKEKMSPEQFHRYMQYVFDTQFKSPEDKIAKKRMIKKINVANKKKGLPLFTEWTVKQQKKYKIGTKMKPIKMGKTQRVTKDKKYRILTIRQWLKFPNYAHLTINRTHHIDTMVDGKIKQLPVVFVDKQDKVVKLEHVDEGFGGELKGADKKKFEKARKENAEQLGYTLTGTSDVKVVNESVNTARYKKLPDKQKVLVHLIDKGNKASDAKKMVARFYDKVSKSYKNASIPKKAEIISSLSGFKSFKEGDLGPTTKKGKTVKAVHKKSGKEIVVVDTSSSRKKLKRMGFIVKEDHHWSIEPSGIMAKINKIVQDKQAMKIGGVLIDMFSAGIMMQIYDKVNDKSKEQMNKGNIRQVQVILHKVMKHNKVKA